MNASELRKYFKNGDHVKVIAGRYEGDTGMVVRVEDNLVVLISDLGVQEVAPSFYFFLNHVSEKSPSQRYTALC